MIELFGWVGNILFAISAAPQAWMSLKQGHTQGVSRGMLACWSVGEVCAGIYGYAKDVPLPILLNYGFNFVCLSIIVYYTVLPRKET